MSMRMVIAGVLTAIVLAIIGLALWVVGPPSGARASRFDEQRVNDLQSIASAVDAYHASRKQLPPELSEITAWPDHPVTLRDPENNAPYTYRVLDAGTYELCATFAAASAEETGPNPGFWKHPAGPYCYRVRAR